jgi:hypothetical protein
VSLIGSSCLLVCRRDLCICRNFEAHELSYEQWKSVLHLSTRWEFASLRNLKSIRPPTSHDQLVLARTYWVDEWVLPALTALCSRTLPLSLDEARQMDIEDVILVAAVREESVVVHFGLTRLIYRGMSKWRRQIVLLTECIRIS